MSESNDFRESFTISCYDSHAQSYDLYQFAVVPGYRDMLDLVASACKRRLPEKARILDLGCGTGNASLAILQQLPSARIFLLDGSPEMVEIAARKLEQAHPGAILGSRVADLCWDGWQQGIEAESFNAIVSTLVLEHLPFPAYRAAIAGCQRLLLPGGWLLAAEGYSDEGSDAQEWFYSLMEERRRMVEPQVSDYIARLREVKETHYYCSREQKAAWWQEAGFEAVCVLWQYLCIALMAGRKQSEGVCAGSSPVVSRTFTTKGTKRTKTAFSYHTRSAQRTHSKQTSIATENIEETAKILSAKYLFREQSQQLPGDNGDRTKTAQPGPIAPNRIGAGFAKLAKGAGLKILSRRSSRVRIPYPASENIDFAYITFREYFFG